MKLPRILIAFDGKRWHVRRVKRVSHDLALDEMVYHCDMPVTNDHPTLKAAISTLPSTYK